MTFATYSRSLCTLAFGLSIQLGLGCNGGAQASGDDEYELTEAGQDDGTTPESTAASDTEAAAESAKADEALELGSTSQALLAPSSLVRAFDLTVLTGGDDLRGGNDNAFVTFFLDDGRLVEASINDGFRLADHTSRFVRVPVPGGARFSLLAGFEICGTMRGGLGGDNWNIDALRVDAVNETASQVVFSNFGAPLVRLTGDQRCVFFNL